MAPEARFFKKIFSLFLSNPSHMTKQVFIRQRKWISYKVSNGCDDLKKVFKEIIIVNISIFPFIRLLWLINLFLLIILRIVFQINGFGKE